MIVEPATKIANDSGVRNLLAGFLGSYFAGSQTLFFAFGVPTVHRKVGSLAKGRTQLNGRRSSARN